LPIPIADFEKLNLIDNCKSAMFGDPLNLIRLTPSKGETVNRDRSILFDFGGTVFLVSGFKFQVEACGS